MDWIQVHQQRHLDLIAEQRRQPKSSNLLELYNLQRDFKIFNKKSSFILFFFLASQNVLAWNMW